MGSLVLPLLLAFSTPSFALNYFIHSSCNNFPAVKDALPEALRMATRSAKRLETDDADIQVAFQRLYNTNTADTGSKNEVHRIMSGVSQMTQTSTLKTSDLRIYCDEDNRWTLQADRKNVPGTPNSQQPADKQIWIDKTNGIFYRGPPGCKDPGTIAEVFDDQSPSYKSQPPKRATMTVCKPYVEAKISTIDQQKNKDFTQVKLSEDVLSLLLSVTFMHELTHIPAFDTLDKDPAYGWANIIAKSTADALKNAENYAFFGLLSLLGDKGFKLSDIAQEATDGKLVRTATTYPKRMVTAALRSLRRCKDRNVRSQDPKCNA